MTGRNTVKAINTWAIPVICYTAGIVDWAQAELDADCKSKKMYENTSCSTPHKMAENMYIYHGRFVDILGCK